MYCVTLMYVFLKLYTFFFNIIMINYIIKSIYSTYACESNKRNDIPKNKNNTNNPGVDKRLHRIHKNSVVIIFTKSMKTKKRIIKKMRVLKQTLKTPTPCQKKKNATYLFLLYTL